MNVVESLHKAYSLVHKYPSSDAQIQSECNTGYMVEKVEIPENDAILMHYSGMEYPERGNVPANDVFHANIVKKLIIDSLRILPLLTPSIVIFIFLPFKYKLYFLNKIVHWFNEIAWRAMSASIYKYEHLNPTSKFLYDFIIIFTKELGIKEYQKLTELFVNTINSDTAYWRRLQDILNETDKNKMKEPRKEIPRLLKILRERENVLGDCVPNKFKLAINVILLSLLHPKVKRAYNIALEQVDIEKVKPDQLDTFWMCVRGGYNFFGLSSEERRKAINHLKVAKPTKIVV
jgi:hypothetical protein